MKCRWMFAKHGQITLPFAAAPGQPHHRDHRHERFRDVDMRTGCMNSIDVIYDLDPKDKCHRYYSWVGLDEVGSAPEEDGYTSW